MSGWTSFTSIAKSALSKAQQKIDNVLDIRDDGANVLSADDSSAENALDINKLKGEFFSAFGLQPSVSKLNVPSQTVEDEKEEEDDDDDDEVSESNFNNNNKSNKVQDENAITNSWSSWLNLDLQGPLNLANQKMHFKVATESSSTCEEFSLLSPVTVQPHFSDEKSKLILVEMDSNVETSEIVDDVENGPNSAKTVMNFFNENDNTKERFIFESKSDDFIEISLFSNVDKELNDQQIIYHILCNILSKIELNVDSSSSPILTDVICDKKIESHSPPPMLPKNSGYSSPLDDLETNVSSDIEVISTPNGDYGSETSSHVATQPSWFAQLESNSSDEPFKTFDDTKANSDLAKLKKVIELRERRLVDLSSENVRISIENEQLRRELMERRQSTSDLTLEKEYNSILKQKRHLEQKVDFMEKELSTKVSAQQFQQVVADKERQICELLAEGEKLAMKELKANNLVKKMRKTEAENVEKTKKLTEKIQEMENLKHELKTKEEQELKYDCVVSDLKSIVEKQEKLIEKFQKDYEDLEEKSNGYKNAMNNLNNENSTLKKQLSEIERNLENLKSSFSEAEQANLSQRLEIVNQGNEDLKKKHFEELQFMRSQLQSNASRQQKIEYLLRQDIERLEMKLQEADEKNMQHIDTSTNATKPLLQQIESLTCSIRNQQANFECVEKSLYEKFVQSERNCSILKEKEENLRKTFERSKSEWLSNKKNYDNLLMENARLEKSFNQSHVEIDQLKLCIEKLKSELEDEILRRTKSVEEVQKEKETLVCQFEFEKNQSKHSYEQKIKDLSQRVDDQENLIKSLRIELENSSTYKNRRLLDSPRMSESSVFDPTEDYGNYSSEIPNGSFSTILEHFRTKLQERERDIWICKEELKNIQLSRDGLAASLTLLNDEKIRLEKWVEDNQNLKENYQKLDQTYQALLQMYGEKIEENDELKLDLLDVKTMYKQHIEEFISQESSKVF